MTHRNPSSDRAIALHYKDAGELPKVTATGFGEIAKKIVELANQHNIPVQENAALANMLSKARPGQGISTASFSLVAQVISFLYHTDKEWSDTHEFLDPIIGEDLSDSEDPAAK